MRPFFFQEAVLVNRINLLVEIISNASLDLFFQEAVLVSRINLLVEIISNANLLIKKVVQAKLNANFSSAHYQPLSLF